MYNHFLIHTKTSYEGTLFFKQWEWDAENQFEWDRKTAMEKVPFTSYLLQD